MRFFVILTAASNMDSANDVLLAKSRELKQQPFSLLAQLPNQQEHKVQCSDGLITIAVWKDAFGDAELRIVIQAYRPGVLGIGRMQAAGFRVTPSEVKELRKDELAEFS